MKSFSVRTGVQRSFFRHALFGDTLLPKAAARAALEISKRLDPLHDDHPPITKRNLFRPHRYISGATAPTVIRTATDRAMRRNARHENITAINFRAAYHLSLGSRSKENRVASRVKKLKSTLRQPGVPPHSSNSLPINARTSVTGKRSYGLISYLIVTGPAA